MIITCPSCLSRFAVKAEAIGFSGRMVRCAKCKHSWFQDPPEQYVEHVVNITSEPDEIKPIPQGSNLPAHAEEKIEKSHYIYHKLALAASVVIFIFTLSIVCSNKILPHIKWYYAALGIYDDAEIALYNISAEKTGDGKQEELIIKGRMVNESKDEKFIPNLRITLLDANRKNLRTVTLKSTKTPIAAGGGVDFENSIKNPPESMETVVMDAGNSVNLATR